MTREEALNEWILPALQRTWNEKKVKEILKTLEQEPCEDTISRQAVDTLVDELAGAISDERCCMSRGRSTATIMQDILDLPSVTPKQTDAFDKIRAEIEALPKTYPFINHIDSYVKEDDVRKIIDKYRAESE